MTDPIVIVSAARTPMAAFQGQFSSLTAPQLGGKAIAAALSRGTIDAGHVDEVIMGCVLPAGQGQAPARQAGINAGLPVSVGATTINKMCGSGMKAVMLGHDLIRAEAAKVVVAGGMESMTNAPYLMDRARGGYRMGHGRVIDHMFLDGLEDAYDRGRLMGTFAEDCADRYQFSRAAQDEYAIRSLKRAQEAGTDGTFAREIEPVVVESRAGRETVSIDEQPPKGNPDKIPKMKPAFRPDGTVTAANASSISDGAAALILMRRSQAEKEGKPILAEIVAHVTHAQEPAWFSTAPIGAINTVLARAGWTQKDVDLYEINEAFAVVPMAAMQELNLSAEQVNVLGGACALGHPIGASGARIIITLITALAKYGLKNGVAAVCIGGGEATAVALRRLA